MDLPDLLDETQCRIDQRFAGKDACLADLARRAAVVLRLEPGPILDALRHREALGSTGLGGGIALPHARLASVMRPFVLVTRLREPIAFEAVDDKPVDLVCMALLPAGTGAGQLNVLACLARRLRDPDLAGAIRKAPDARRLHALLTQ